MMTRDQNNCKPANTENTQPNVILITLDAFCCELFTRSIEDLPNMKKLKSQSVYFENAFSVGPTTEFSFPGIIGGIYPYHFGIGIDKSVRTIDCVLKESGYNTALLNESNAFLSPFFGYGRNCDYQNHFLELSHATIDRKLINTFMKEELNPKQKDPWNLRSILTRIYKKLNNKRIKQFGKFFLGIYKFAKFYTKEKTESFEVRQRLYDEFRKEILWFIKERFTPPQFLWIHTIVNHVPYLPLEDSGKFSIKETNYLNYLALSGLVNYGICKKLKALHIESMRRTDQLIGDIMIALSQRNLLHNSILVVTSDHGEEFMEEGYLGHVGESSSDRLLHVPLLFYYPDLNINRTISFPVSTIDIMPTICDLIGIGVPVESRGISLKKMIMPEQEDLVNKEKFCSRPLFSEAWKLKGLLDRDPADRSYVITLTVRKDKYKLKLRSEQKSNNLYSERLTLLDWISNKNLDLKSNNQIISELMGILWHHIYEEGIFARNLRTEYERRRIKDKSNRLRHAIRLSM